jgi:catechol-2,3-dioxygenase
MAEIGFRLQHLNMPARDPEGLARWYANTFGLQADDNKARGPGVLIAFQSGEPINRAPELHAGFLVPSLAELNQWADRLGGTLKTGAEFTSFQLRDPEGNCVEIYCRNE